jgi:anti-sigma regulatory factor (Ser/Thr protein kinase)/anti-anti-sigma regulatory factor
VSVRASERYTIAVPEELTPTAMAGFEARLREALEFAPAAVFLDCEKLRHITSSYVNVFWSAYERCASAGIGVQLHEPPDGLIRTLQVMDLAHFFNVEEPDGGSSPADDPARLISTAGVYTDRFRPDTGGIDAAADRFVGFLARTGVAESTEFELRTVFYEVATNIRLHAKPDPFVDVMFTTTVAEEMLVLCFRYTGVEFDPTPRGPELDFVAAARTGQKRGFGLAMLHRLTDRVAYVRDETGWNVLTVEKNRSRES